MKLPRVVVCSSGNPFNQNEKIVCKDFIVRDILVDGELTTIKVYEGFKTDGASIPRFFWRLFHPWLNGIAEAAIIHDWLYMVHLTTRKEADKIFRQLLKRYKISKVKRNLMYYALRAFGWIAWKSHGRTDERYAVLHGVMLSQILH